MIDTCACHVYCAFKRPASSDCSGFAFPRCVFRLFHLPFHAPSVMSLELVDEANDVLSYRDWLLLHGEVTCVE